MFASAIATPVPTADAIGESVFCVIVVPAEIVPLPNAVVALTPVTS